MAITIGLWVLPLITTLVAIVWFYIRSFNSGYMDFGVLFDLPIAVIISLLAWLIYFIIV
jgi:hypothetical protein